VRPATRRVWISINTSSTDIIVIYQLLERSPICCGPKNGEQPKHFPSSIISLVYSSQVACLVYCECVVTIQ